MSQGQMTFLNLRKIHHTVIQKLVPFLTSANIEENIQKIKDTINQNGGHQE